MNTSIDFSKILTLLKPLKPYGSYLVVLALLGVFGYTGWIINSSFSPQPTAAEAASSGKVIFDQTTINKVKSLNQVNVETDGSALGDNTTSPFGN